MALQKSAADAREALSAVSRQEANITPARLTLAGKTCCGELPSHARGRRSG
jgi:hypothetical protein